MKKALVTGGNGFIGSHLVDGLLLAGYQVRVLDLFGRRYGSLPQEVEHIQGDMSTDYAVRESLAGIDVVFHLAWTSIHEVATRDPQSDIETNLMPSVRLISQCCQSDVQRLVFLSSGGTVYGTARRLPIDEGHPTDPISAYGITKLAVEKYLQMYHHLYGLQYAILRPSVPYGPGQDPRRRQGAVSTFLNRATRDEPIEIWGDGSVVRDYFYVDDLVTAVLAAASAPPSLAPVYNIGGGRGYSLNDLLAVIERVTGRKARVEYQPGRPFDVPALVLDTSRARAELGWTPQVDLSAGIERTWAWINSLGGSDAQPMTK
jgi:UDP-glucose 4-epimerase